MTSQPDGLSKPTKKQRAAARAQRAAELKAEQERRERQRRVLSIGAVVVAVVVVVGGFFLIQTTGEDDAPATPAADSAYSFVQGPADAPHTLVIYEDFLCPFCGEVEAEIGAQLDQLAADGQVQVDYRPISILSRVSEYSADALNAFFVVRDTSGSEVTDEFHDRLFAGQPAESGPFPRREDLLALALEAGAEESAVSAGILDGTRMADVEAATEEAADAGVTGTPTLVLDGERFTGGDTIEEIGANLIAAIEAG